MLIAVCELSDGGNNGCGAGAESFGELSAVARFDEFFNGEGTLFDFNAHLTRKSHYAAAGDAGENGIFKGSGNELSVDQEHHVHCADLLDVLHMLAVEPQYLAVTLFFRLGACKDGACIVAAGLCKAGAAADCADVSVFNADTDGCKACLIVCAGGGADDIVEIALGSMYAESLVGRYHRGAQIQAGAGAVGYPIALDLNELPHCLVVILDIYGGHAKTDSGIVQALCIVPCTEHEDSVVIGTVCLEAFKNLLCIMEYGAGRIEAQLLIGNDTGIMPLAVIIVHHEHMIAETLTETQGAFLFTGGLFLKLSRLGNGNIHCLPPEMQQCLCCNYSIVCRALKVYYGNYRKNSFSEIFLPRNDGLDPAVRALDNLLYEIIGLFLLHKAGKTDVFEEFRFLHYGIRPHETLKRAVARIIYGEADHACGNHVAAPGSIQRIARTAAVRSDKPSAPEKDAAEIPRHDYERILRI